MLQSNLTRTLSKVQYLSEYLRYFKRYSEMDFRKLHRGESCEI